MKNLKNLIFYLLMIILIIYGFFLRFYSLSQQSLWIDEGFSINAAIQTLKYAIPRLESGFVYGGGIINTYFMAFFIKIFNDSIFASRFVSLIFGILSIIITYLLGKEVYSKKIGIIAALFVTFSSIEIAWSRQARMYSQLQFFFLLSLFLFFKFSNNKKLKYFISTLVLTLVTIFTHSLGFSLILIYLVYFILNYKDFKFIFTNKFLIPLFILSIPFIYLLIVSFTDYNYIYVNYFLKYIYFLRFSHEILFYFSLIGMIISIWEFKKSSFLFISFFIPLLILSFFIFLMHYRYLFFILPILFIFAAYLIVFISNYFKKFKYIATGILTLIVLLSGFTFIPKDNYELESLTPQPDFKKTYSYIENNYKDEIIIDAYPVLSKIYFKEADYGLMFSLSGRQEEILNMTHDIYTGKPFVSLEELENIANCFLIIDKLAIDRINPKIRSFIDNMTFIEEGSDLKNNISSVKLYRC